MLKKTICILLIFILCLTVFSACGNRYSAVLLSDGYELDETFAENNKVGYGYYDQDGTIKYRDEEGIERPKEIVRVIGSREEAKEIFSSFSAKVDYKKEMLIVYVFMSISPRRCRVRKTKKENDTVFIELRYQRKFFAKDATSPQQKIFVIKMKKTEAKEFRIKVEY